MVLVKPPSNCEFFFHFPLSKCVLRVDYEPNKTFQTLAINFFFFYVRVARSLEPKLSLYIRSLVVNSSRKILRKSNQYSCLNFVTLETNMLCG